MIWNVSVKGKRGGSEREIAKVTAKQCKFAVCLSLVDDSRVCIFGCI